jgi:tetratricopeptide (TPR) repeat protein
VLAQTPAAGDTGAPGQTKPAPTQTGSNPFPEDTNSIPVLAAKPDSNTSGEDSSPSFGRTALPDEDLDPVRSPDDAAAEPSAMDSGSSSSLAGLDRLLPGRGDDQKETKRKLNVKEPTHREAASKDIEVGGYYLETKNWKAAESRFESAMVLDPDNPEVFWGLAEAERHLGNFADARTHYQTVLVYDPDGKHGKDARKALKEPEIANAKAVASTPAK